MKGKKLLFLNDDPDLQELYEFLFDLYKWDYEIISSEKELSYFSPNEILFIDSNNIDFLSSVMRSIQPFSKIIVSTVSPFDKIIEESFPYSKRLVKPFTVKTLRNTLFQVGHS